VPRQGYDAPGEAKANAVPASRSAPSPAAAAGAEALVLCTEWPEFADLDFARLKAGMVRPLLLDGRNALDREALTALGFEVLGIGRGQALTPRRPA
jgi:UDPglucose 6-dehydrogenase